MSQATSSITLGDVPFFSAFPAASLEALARAATIRKFRKSTQIIVSGEESHAAYVLLEGTAYAFADDDDGNEFIISTFGPGDCFGELGLLDGESRTANVITTSACECIVVPRAELMREIREHAEVAEAVIQSLVGRIRGMTEDVSCLALMDVYGRLARVLEQSMTDHDDGSRMTGKVTHQELASRVGSSREMISKILKDLRIGGYISVVDRCIRLEKPLPTRW